MPMPARQPHCLRSRSTPFPTRLQNVQCQNQNTNSLDAPQTPAKSVSATASVSNSEDDMSKHCAESLTRLFLTILIVGLTSTKVQLPKSYLTVSNQLSERVLRLTNFDFFLLALDAGIRIAGAGSVDMFCNEICGMVRGSGASGRCRAGTGGGGGGRRGRRVTHADIRHVRYVSGTTN